ncbi:MAG: hypothetical protein AAF699_00375 [Pseudomonadota bacterium]
MLEQYYALREKCFRQELKIPSFDGSEEQRDRDSSILIMRDGDQCIGGARIAPSTELAWDLTGLAIDTDTCCMWERFVIDPSKRTVHSFREFCSQLVSTSRDIGYNNALVLSSLRNARFYRQFHSALGVEFRILGQAPEAASPTFKGLEHYLSVSTLRQVERARVAA